MSDEQPNDRAQSNLYHWTLNSLHHPYQQVHECRVNESIGHIGVHNYGLEVEQGVDLLVHGGVACQAAVDVGEVGLDLLGLDLGDDLLGRPGLEGQVLRVVLGLDGLLNLLVADDGLDGSVRVVDD